MIQKYQNRVKILTVAIGFSVATFLLSCKSNVEVHSLDLSQAPAQRVIDMYVVQSKDGGLQMRMEAPIMERYEKEDNSYELFPNGFNVYGYNNEGLLETCIKSNEAKHTTSKGEEKWEAYGNVVITNYIKGERMETDTLYWDRENQRIFTHCLVKMYSPTAFMQGYGMESDEMARNAEITNPFDSYGVVADSLGYYVDTVNFIGPVLKLVN